MIIPLWFTSKKTDRNMLWLPTTVFMEWVCVVLIAVNVIFVPQYGYIACAWAGFAGYATAMTLSYIVGQKYYPIKYDLGRIAVYVILTLITFGLIKFNEYIWDNIVIRIIGNTVLLILFVSYIVKKDFPISPILKKLGIKN